MIPISPLQLKQHFFTLLSIRANPNGSNEAPINLEPVVFCNRSSKEPNHWSLGLGLKLKSADRKKPYIYEVEVEIQALVEVSSVFSEEKRDQLAFVNGLSLLYSAIREMLLTVTGRSAHGPMCVPTLNFGEIFARWNAENKEKETRAERADARAVK